MNVDDLTRQIIGCAFKFIGCWALVFSKPFMRMPFELN
jgi:hypothetical protein